MSTPAVPLLIRVVESLGQDFRLTKKFDPNFVAREIQKVKEELGETE